MSLTCFIRYQIDAEGRENFLMAQRLRFILREERSFCMLVPGTFNGLPHPLNLPQGAAA